MSQNQKIVALLEELLVVLSEEKTEVPSVPAKKKAPKISGADRKKANKARQKNFSEVLAKAKASKGDQDKCRKFLLKAMAIASDAGNSKPRIWHGHVSTVEKCHRAWIKA